MFSSPGAKLVVAILVAVALAIPVGMVWLLVLDRESQSETAQTSIAQGWAGPQTIAGPVLVIPYRTTVEESATEDGRQIRRTREVWETRTLSPESVELATEVRPERRTRAIYETIVYDAAVQGRARFALPVDLVRQGIDPARMDLTRAELRFRLSDPRGLGANPRVLVDGTALRLQPGGGRGGGSGFFAWIDASGLTARPVEVTFQFDARGNRLLALEPQAGDTRWTVRSSWPHPSFGGGFLPTERSVDSDGFTATYRIGNLALGQALIGDGAVPVAGTAPTSPDGVEAAMAPGAGGGGATVQIDLVQPVDLYDQVGRALKYGFLFIGFTFLAFLLFDIVGGVKVSAIEYLLVGIGLVLFFVLLLALGEVIGFALAYVAASAAITGLITFYSAAVMKSWRRAAAIAGLLAALYGALYLLLSLEAYSLLIGSLMLFAALASVMYLTRNLNWGSTAQPEEQVPVAEPSH